MIAAGAHSAAFRTSWPARQPCLTSRPQRHHGAPWAATSPRPRRRQCGPRILLALVAQSPTLGRFLILLLGPSDSSNVSINIVKIEYVTKGPYGEMLEQSFTFNAVPCPKITAQVDSASVSANGTVTMTISGHVTDDTSDLIDTPSKQLQSLDVLVNGQSVQTITLTSTATPEYPWRPYKFQSQQFTATVQCAIGGLGEGYVTLQTAENAAGCASSLSFGATVYEKQKEHRFNIAFPTGQASESMVFYVGEDRPGIENEVLTESPPESGIFKNLLFWADVEVRVLNFGGLTPELDSLRARMSFKYSSGVAETHELTFFETGPADSRFCATVSQPVDGMDLGGYLNLVLPATFDAAGVDTCRMYVGDRGPGAEDFILAEIDGPASRKFNGDATWADVTVQLAEFTPLTDDYDTIQTEWTFLRPDGSQETLNVAMVETGTPQSCRFVCNLGVKNRYDVLAAASESSSDTGTFFPTIIRIKAAPGIFEESDLEVETFERTWDVKHMDFGDGEFFYVVDDQQHAVVFNPAAYAHSHIQTGPVKWWVTGLSAKGDLLISRVLGVQHGLVVENDDITSMLSNITNFKKDTESVGAKNFYVYKAESGKEVGHTNDALSTEVLWRYVGTTNTIAAFHSRAELEQDILAREKIVEAARTASFAFGGATSFNSDYWIAPWNVKSRGGSASAFDAIADAWTHPDKYRMACLDGAQMVFHRGASQALGKATFDARVGRLPWHKRWEIKKRRSVPAGDDANWIPGDWGYIDNTSPTASGLITGENIIYLGGCFERSVNAFKANSDFWVGSSQRHQDHEAPAMDRQCRRLEHRWRGKAKKPAGLAEATEAGVKQGGRDPYEENSCWRIGCCRATMRVRAEGQQEDRRERPKGRDNYARNLVEKL